MKFLLYLLKNTVTIVKCSWFCYFELSELKDVIEELSNCIFVPYRRRSQDFEKMQAIQAVLQKMNKRFFLRCIFFNRLRKSKLLLKRLRSGDGAANTPNFIAIELLQLWGDLGHRPYEVSWRRTQARRLTT